MRTAKLVIGILSCVLVLVVMLQSCGATFITSVENSGDISGAAGVVFGIILLAAGVTAIAGRDSKGGTIAAGVLYVLGGILGVTQNGVYGDLQVWAWVSLIFGAVFFLSLIGMNPQAAPKSASGYTPSWIENEQWTPPTQSTAAPPTDAPPVQPMGEAPAQTPTGSGQRPRYQIVFPRHYEEANKRHGIVIALRVIAILQMVGFMAFALLWSTSTLPGLLVVNQITDAATAQSIALPIGIAIGIFGGFMVTLSTWVLALVVDDLHAMRIYLGGFNVYDQHDRE